MAAFMKQRGAFRRDIARAAEKQDVHVQDQSAGLVADNASPAATARVKDGLILTLRCGWLTVAARQLNSLVIDSESFEGHRLRGGFVIAGIEWATEALTDALGREAIAQTRINGRSFHLLIRRGLSDKELSVTMYHEVLEAALVASTMPPGGLMDFNEGDFEHAAYQMHEALGFASPDNLNAMLKHFGFGQD
jgi:hypothetical protein